MSRIFTAPRLPVPVAKPVERPAVIRAFVAIHLPAEVVARLHELQQLVQNGLPDDAVRWAPPKQIHLTLKFIGNTSTDHVEDLRAALEPICRTVAPLTLRAEGVGCFPSLVRPRVIWVGLNGELQQLRSLQSRIAPAAQPWCRRTDERAFRPHLTLGRVREVEPRVARRIGEKLSGTRGSLWGEWRAEEVCLMRSELSTVGANHSLLATLPLAGKR